MSLLKKRLTLVLGVAAGAALTALAVSKNGQKELKKLTEKTAELRESLLSTIEKDINSIKRTKGEFI
ncbi:MAG: hypothetical protein ABFS32_05725 [Bacteroidota bacterium]